jgi:outer membrane lipoprotein-sorting protein
VTADEAFSEATKVFGDWEERDVAAPVFVEPPDPTRRVVVINKPDAVQTEVRVGHIGVPRKSPDYMALNLAIRILGGEGSNRLHQVLRTERGLTYGAQAQFDTLKWSGDIEAETNTRSEATGEVLRLIVDEFWRLQRERVGERELADAKAYLTGSFPLTIETPDQIALQVLNNVFYEIPLSELQNFRERVNAVTVDDIQRVARAYLKPDRLSVVLVGNAAAFRSQLPGVGFGQFETVELGNLDLTTTNFKHDKPASGGRLQPIAYQTPAPMVSKPPIVPEEGEKAKALLDRVVAAKGGLETLGAVKTVTALMTAPTKTPDGRDLQVETRTLLQYPSRVRVEIKLPTATVQQVYDGQRGWILDPNGVHDADAPMLRNFEMSFKRDTVPLLVAAARGTVRARILPDVKDDAGRRYQALELSRSDMEPVVLSIDPESGLIAKQTFVAGPGQPVIEERFADYRAVDGVQVPFTTTVFAGGQRVGDRHITDIKFNAPIDPALFKRPQH